MLRFRGLKKFLICFFVIIILFVLLKYLIENPNSYYHPFKIKNTLTEVSIGKKLKKYRCFYYLFLQECL